MLVGTVGSLLSRIYLALKKWAISAARNIGITGGASPTPEYSSVAVGI